MPERLLSLVLLFTGGLVLTAGDILMKTWVSTNRRALFVAGLVVWLVGLVFLAKSFKYENIAVASIIFVTFNVVTLALVSWLYFRETLTGTQITGILLGIAAVAVLEFAHGNT